jgi:arginyl-tRNA synthetase
MPPKNSAHGDLSSDIAFKISKRLKAPPAATAEKALGILKEKIRHSILNACVERIEIVPPGFINFYFNENFFSNVLKKIYVENEAYGKSQVGRARRVIIEYVSANPTGPLTIAHGRQACVGDALARILKMAGYVPHREYYMNDSGRQMNLLGKSLHARYSELVGETGYPLPEEGYQGDYLIEIARQVVKEKSTSLVGKRDAETENYFYRIAKDKIFEGIQKDLQDADVRFDDVFSEKSLFETGEVEDCLKLLREKGKLYEKDGALWLKTQEGGDDKDRVLKKNTGETTYLTPDIAYHRGKFKRGFDWIVNLWGPDHHGYIARLKAALASLGYDAAKIQILIVQLTTLYRNGEPVRMSTRSGEFVTFRELLDEVGVDATRFFFLMRRIESHLDFDLELAKKKSDENPVYYLQYAHARICSILKKSEKPVEADPDFGLLKAPEELELIRALGEFPDIAAQSAGFLEPYRVVDYLRNLATVFHRFYTFHRVITEDVRLSAARLFLVNACRLVLRNGLNVLGISSPERM